MDFTDCIRGRILLAAIIGFSGVVCSDACQRAMLNSNGVSHNDRQKVLDMHNAIRQATALGKVGGQPPAANMLEMKWDDELAQRAQKWAVSCLSEDHDPQRQTSRFVLGQNIATFWTSRRPSSSYDMAPEFAKAINGWFKEVFRYRFSTINGYTPAGHYTQMVWADTNLVGCGYSFYYDPSKGFTKNYICNYGPAGNVVSKLPYEKGYPSCGNFGLESSRRWQGLCVKPSRYYYGISNYIETGVNKAHIQNILYMHNAYQLLLAQGRILTQSKVMKMKRMYWDQALAKEAQKIGNTCEFKHVPVHDAVILF